MPKLGRKTPCPGCPWLRISRRGYLGEDEPESFYRGAITNENDWPCHEQIDYTDPKWLKRQLPDADLCAGQLIHFRNHLKMPRDPQMADAVRSVKRSKHVFEHPEEFMRHHVPDADEETVRLMARDAMLSCPQRRNVVVTQGPPVTVTLPGGFLDWFDGTGVGQGEDVGPETPDRQLLYELWTAAPLKRAGRGRFVRLEFPSTREGLEALEVLINHAVTGEMVTAEDPDNADEHRAVRKGLDRAVEQMRVLEARLGAPKAHLVTGGIARVAW